MKRIEQLQPLSREHHQGLVISRHAKECANDVEEIAKHWTALTEYVNQNMSNHFKVEDDLILAKLAAYEAEHPEVAEVMAEIEAHHSKLYELVNTPSLSASHVQEFAALLYDHIRYEECELFPLAQALLSEQELQAIYDASSANVKRDAEQR